MISSSCAIQPVPFLRLFSHSRLLNARVELKPLVTDFPTTRICSKCGQEKSLSEFHRDRSNVLGIQHRCKECTKIKNKQYALENREYFKKKGKEKYDPTQNQERYEKTRDNYLARATAYRATPRGKLKGLLVAAKKRSAKSGLPFDLTIEWVLELFHLQDGTCSMTGLPFSLERGGYNERFQNPFSPSLDRINSTLGYTENNTRLVCTIVNLALNRFGDDAFDLMCESYVSRKSRSLS